MKAYFFAVFAILCWSFNVVVASSLVDTLTPWQIAFIRWIIAAILIFIFCFHRLKKHWKIILKYKYNLLWTSFWGITVSNTCVYYAAHTVKPVTLSLIGATGPLFLIFFTWILKGVRLSGRQFLGLAITLAGVALIVIHGRSQVMGLTKIQSGDWWMLATAITFGYYSFRVAHKPKELPYFSFLAACIIFGALMCVPFFTYDTWIHPLSFQTNLTPKIIWIMLFMGVFNSLLAYLFWNRALEIGNPIHVAMIYYLMPVFSTIESWALLGDKVHMIHLIGGVVILAGIWLGNSQSKSALPQQNRQANP